VSPNPQHVLIGSRTVIESGNSSAVTVPPEVLCEMGVEPGDSVVLVYDRDEQELIVGDDDGSYLDAR